MLQAEEKVYEVMTADGLPIKHGELATRLAAMKSSKAEILVRNKKDAAAHGFAKRMLQHMAVSQEHMLVLCQETDMCKDVHI